MFMVYFIHNVLTKYSHLQCDVIITRIQRYRRGWPCHHHSITVNVIISDKIMLSYMNTV